MDISTITEAIQRDANWVVFVNVLLQQLGLPVPVMPTLLIAGSLALSSGHALQLLAVATLASLIADCAWYLVGRAFGYRVLSGLCKLSINPGSCVSETESRFVRWGVWSLLIAKFVPGFSTVAPPIAGSLRMSMPSFMVAAGLGAALWAGAALLAGLLLRDEVNIVIGALSDHGRMVVAVLAVGLGIMLAWKLWRRHGFKKLSSISRITPVELAQALSADAPLLLLDFRGAAQTARTGPLAGFTPASLDDLAQQVSQWPKHHGIVTMCACPEDATAVHAAQRLKKLGYTSVRPLKGGYESWMLHLKKKAA